MRRRRKAKVRVFCHLQKPRKEEKNKMFLHYELQFELANQHRRELEAQAAKARLIQLISKPQSRIWKIATLLDPRVIGVEVSGGEPYQPLIVTTR